MQKQVLTELAQNVFESWEGGEQVVCYRWKKEEEHGTDGEWVGDEVAFKLRQERIIKYLRAQSNPGVRPAQIDGGAH